MPGFATLTRLPRPFAWLWLIAAPLVWTPALAEGGKGIEPVDLAPLDKGEVVLEVATPEGVQAYDLAALEDLGVYRITTASQWDQEPPTFEGVLLADLLAKAGLADADAVELTAADDYSQVIPKEDWTTYPVILATRLDGAPLTDRGPLRVVDPLSFFPELDDDNYHDRWVWSLKQIKAVD